MSNIIVYTAIMGNYDTLREPKEKGSAKFVAFLTHQFKSRGWETHLIVPMQDLVRTARNYKIMSHIHFPEAEYTIWVDGNIIPRIAPDVLVEECLSDGIDIAAFRHPSRDCAYQEAARCIVKGKDKSEKLTGQANIYSTEGFPRNYGLVETGFVIRRNTPQVTLLNEKWWEQAEKHSNRDQVGLPYALWKTGTEINRLEGSLIKHNWFEHKAHSSKEVLHGS